MRGSRAVALVAGLIGWAAVAGPAHGATVTATPGLLPVFSTPGATDHAVRCTAGTDVRVDVRPRTGERVSVDGLPARGTPFAAGVPLQPGQSFSIDVRAGKRDVRHHVRCLPPSFPDWKAERFGRPQSKFLIVTPGGGINGAPLSVIFDMHGAPVWWRVGVQANVSVLGRDLIMGVPAGGGTTFERRRLDGTVVRRWKPVGGVGDSHEFLHLANGNVLLLVQRIQRHVDLAGYAQSPTAADSSVLDLEIQELNPAGKRIWSWRASDHIAHAETGRWYKSLQVVGGTAADPVYDLYHTNAFALDGKGLLISMRHTDAIYRIDRATGRITWKLGGTPTKQSLKIVGDPLAAVDFGGQHDVRRLADGTITLYDNGTDRGRGPRGLRFRIDTRERTATRIAQVTDRTVLASPFAGSATRLPGGNWVVAFGGTPTVDELTPGSTPVFRLTLSGPTYRAFSIGATSQVTAARMRAGMDAMAPKRTGRARIVPAGTAAQ